MSISPNGTVYRQEGYLKNPGFHWFIYDWIFPFETELLTGETIRLSLVSAPVDEDISDTVHVNSVIRTSQFQIPAKFNHRRNVPRNVFGQKLLHITWHIFYNA